MKSKDNDKDKITLEILNEKLDSIKCDIKELPKQEENIKIFISTILFSFGLVLVTIAITILLQLLSLSEIISWITVAFYFFCGIFFIYISKFPLERRKKK